MAYNWKTLSQFWIQMLHLTWCLLVSSRRAVSQLPRVCLACPRQPSAAALRRSSVRSGSVLLQPTTRSLNVTDAGRLYYEESSQALRAIEDANFQVAEARTEPSGTIRISAPVGFGGYFLSSAIFDFLAKNQSRVAPDRRQAQSGRERYRPLIPHRESFQTPR
jgi:hypothetical protein